MENFLKTLRLGINDTSEARTLAEDAANMVNSLSVKSEKIADQILADRSILTNSFRPFALAWIEKLDQMYKEKLYDDRNEYSCRIGHNLMNIEYISNISKGSSEMSVMESFCEHMAKAHKTLQQQFSSVVFFFIYKDLTTLGTISDTTFSNAGLDVPYFCNTPFI